MVVEWGLSIKKIIYIRNQGDDDVSGCERVIEFYGQTK